MTLLIVTFEIVCAFFFLWETSRFCHFWLPFPHFCFSLRGEEDVQGEGNQANVFLMKWDVLSSDPASDTTSVSDDYDTAGLALQVLRALYALEFVFAWCYPNNNNCCLHSSVVMWANMTKMMANYLSACFHQSDKHLLSIILFSLYCPDLSPYVSCKKWY